MRMQRRRSCCSPHSAAWPASRGAAAATVAAAAETEAQRVREGAAAAAADSFCCTWHPRRCVRCRRPCWTSFPPPPLTLLPLPLITSPLLALGLPAGARGAAGVAGPRPRQRSSSGGLRIHTGLPRDAVRPRRGRRPWRWRRWRRRFAGRLAGGLGLGCRRQGAHRPVRAQHGRAHCHPAELHAEDRRRRRGRRRRRRGRCRQGVCPLLLMSARGRGAAASGSHAGGVVRAAGEGGRCACRSALLRLAAL